MLLGTVSYSDFASYLNLRTHHLHYSSGAARDSQNRETPRPSRPRGRRAPRSIREEPARIGEPNKVFPCTGRPRALFSGFESSSRPVSMIFSPSSRCQLRLAQQGHGAVQRVVVGLFVHMLARYCQRGSRRRQTGAIVCRLRVRTAGLSASIIVRLKVAVP